MNPITPPLAPTLVPIVHNQQEEIRALFERYVVPTYARFELVLARGQGSSVWDVAGRRFLDLGGGIAVCALGHAHPEIAVTLAEQARRLVHVSNLYYHEPQGRLAREIVTRLAPGKVFFSNSGGEANEGLFKLARKFGRENPGSHGPRYEIITTRHSFHGRTLAGVAATGQERFRKGFEPTVEGFRSDVPYNDLDAMCAAIGPRTAAILIEGVQGEGGVHPASAEYLLGLRRLCDENNLLLMIDAVQCGHFRSGCYQSFQRILEADHSEAARAFRPDAVSMAKSLGGGFPIGAFWVREPFADILGPGTHATTFGGTPLGCSVALKVFEIIERDRIAGNVRAVGASLLEALGRIAREHSDVVVGARGLGFLIGLELAPREKIPAFASDERPASVQFVNRLHAAGVLTIPAGPQVVRLLPALNLSPAEADEGIALIERVVRSLA